MAKLYSPQRFWITTSWETYLVMATKNRRNKNVKFFKAKTKRKLVQNKDENREQSETSRVWKIGSAVFYAICSILIVFVNKSVLTVYSYPSAMTLGIGQMVSAIIVLGEIFSKLKFVLYKSKFFLSWYIIDFLGFLKFLGKIDFPPLSRDIPKQIFPLPILYLCNMIFGLKSTKVSLE